MVEKGCQALFLSVLSTEEAIAVCEVLLLLLREGGMVLGTTDAPEEYKTKEHQYDIAV